GVDALAAQREVEDVGAGMAGPRQELSAALSEGGDPGLARAAVRRREEASDHDPRGPRRHDDVTHLAVGRRRPAPVHAEAAAAHGELRQVPPPQPADAAEAAADVDAARPRHGDGADVAGDAEIGDPGRELAGAQVERRQVVAGVSADRRELAADVEEAVVRRDGQRVDTAVQLWVEAAPQLARPGPLGGEVQPGHLGAAVAAEDGEVAPDVDPAADPDDVVDAAE